MIIPIIEQCRITTDPYQWIIQKRRTRRGREEWESQTYHPSFQSALQSLGEHLVRASDTQTLEEALVAVENVTTTLSQALTPTIEGLEHLKKAGIGP